MAVDCVNWDSQSFFLLFVSLHTGSSPSRIFLFAFTIFGSSGAGGRTCSGWVVRAPRLVGIGDSFQSVAFGREGVYRVRQEVVFSNAGDVLKSPKTKPGVTWPKRYLGVCNSSVEGR